MNSKSITKSRKLRYGAMAAGFTAVFIAIVIVFNAIFSSLASRFGWYADMTSEAVFTMSETSLSYIDDITVDLSGYADDETVASWAKQAMEWANEKKYVTGSTDNCLLPAEYATRAQVATILMRFVEDIR